MTTKKIENKNFSINVLVDNGQFKIRNHLGEILVNLDPNMVRSIINLISYMIDEDLPNMIHKGKWNKNNYAVKVHCEVPFEDMINKE